MKILVYTDPHFCQYSSIVRKRGDKYSQRLENLINSLNWVEQIADEKACDAVFCLGDFFDKPELNAEEITALKEIKWSNNVYHYFLVGNHESNISSLMYSSTNCLKNIPFSTIIDKPCIERWNCNYDFCFLPYILEEDRKPIVDYINKGTPTIIFSHNDIKGIQYGRFESKEGFDLKEIEDNCCLFLNGHLHNGLFLNDKETILNLGNLTGQNFSENSFEYNHLACILDTDTLNLTFLENPYAFNFYKVEINNMDDIQKLKFKSNAVITFKCEHYLVSELKNYLKSIDSSIISDYRIIAVNNKVAETSSGEEIKLNSIDYLQRFTDFVLDKLGNTSDIVEELNQIVGGK